MKKTITFNLADIGKFKDALLLQGGENAKKEEEGKAAHPRLTIADADTE